MTWPNSRALMFGTSPRLTDRSLSAVDPLVAVVTIRLQPTGELETSNAVGVFTNRLPEWWGQLWQSTQDVTTGNLDAQLFVVSGVAPNVGDSVGVWLPMEGTLRAWGRSNGTAGTTETGVWDISIRNRALGGVLTVGRYNISCQRT